MIFAMLLSSVGCAMFFVFHLLKDDHENEMCVLFELDVLLHFSFGSTVKLIDIQLTQPSHTLFDYSLSPSHTREICFPYELFAFCAPHTCCICSILQNELFFLAVGFFPHS